MGENSNLPSQLDNSNENSIDWNNFDWDNFEDLLHLPQIERSSSWSILDSNIHSDDERHHRSTYISSASENNQQHLEAVGTSEDDPSFRESTSSWFNVSHVSPQPQNTFFDDNLQPASDQTQPGASASHDALQTTHTASLPHHGQQSTEQHENGPIVQQTVAPDTLLLDERCQTGLSLQTQRAVDLDVSLAETTSTYSCFAGVAILPQPIDGGQISQLQSSGEAARAASELSTIALSTDVASPRVTSTAKVLEKGTKRKLYSAAGREKVKQVRRSGACLRCKIYKESCDQNTPCSRCIAVSNTAKLFKQPCYREQLDSVIAFRAGNARVGQIRSQPLKLRWSGDDLNCKTVHLHYPFQKSSGGRELALTIECRKFVASAEHVLVEPWTTPDGETILLESTPYACYDAEHCVGAMGDYLAHYSLALLDEAADNLTDPILKLSMAEAARYASKFKESAVTHSLNIRAASYFSRTRMVMSGRNVLEVPYFDDDRINVQSRIPIPAVLDYQIDYMAIQYMSSQMKLVIRRLKKIIFGKDSTRNWYEVYLACFVLLCSLETVHARQIEILHRFFGQGEDVLSKVRFVGRSMIREWEYSAKNLIYHFRAILRGMVPFTSPWDENHRQEMRRRADLDHEALAYMGELTRLIQTFEDVLRRASQEDLDNEAAKPLVWISQLYMEDEG